MNSNARADEAREETLISMYSWTKNRTQSKEPEKDDSETDRLSANATFIDAVTSAALGGPGAIVGNALRTLSYNEFMKLYLWNATDARASSGSSRLYDRAQIPTGMFARASSHPPPRALPPPHALPPLRPAHPLPPLPPSHTLPPLRSPGADDITDQDSGAGTHVGKSVTDENEADERASPSAPVMSLDQYLTLQALASIGAFADGPAVKDKRVQTGGDSGVPEKLGRSVHKCAYSSGKNDFHHCHLASSSIVTVIGAWHDGVEDYLHNADLLRPENKQRREHLAKNVVSFYAWMRGILDGSARADFDEERRPALPQMLEHLAAGVCV